MKLRIVKIYKNDFVPEFYDESSNKWCEFRIDDRLDCIHHTLDEAKKVIEEYKRRHPKPEVVWEEEY